MRSMSRSRKKPRHRHDDQRQQAGYQPGHARQRAFDEIGRRRTQRLGNTIDRRAVRFEKAADLGVGARQFDAQRVFQPTAAIGSKAVARNRASPAPDRATRMPPPASSTTVISPHAQQQEKSQKRHAQRPAHAPGLQPIDHGVADVGQHPRDRQGRQQVADAVQKQQEDHRAGQQDDEFDPFVGPDFPQPTPSRYSSSGGGAGRRQHAHLDGRICVRAPSAPPSSVKNSSASPAAADGRPP